MFLNDLKTFFDLSNIKPILFFATRFKTVNIVPTCTDSPIIYCNFSLWCIEQLNSCATVNWGWVSFEKSLKPLATITQAMQPNNRKVWFAGHDDYRFVLILSIYAHNILHTYQYNDVDTNQMNEVSRVKKTKFRKDFPLIWLELLKQSTNALNCMGRYKLNVNYRYEINQLITNGTSTMEENICKNYMLSFRWIKLFPTKQTQIKQAPFIMIVKITQRLLRILQRKSTIDQKNEKIEPITEKNHDTILTIIL